MKKSLLLIVLVYFAAFFSNAQDIVTGYTFSTGDPATDIYPDEGLEANSGYYISAEDTVAHPNTNKREITFTEGYTGFAATSLGWNDGEMAKLWSIKFKAEGYKDLKVSSRQCSGDEFPGPRDWKIQARISGSDWVDLDGGTITCGTDWITGVASAIELPDQFDNPGSTSLFIRWIMTSSLDVNGNTVDSTGISKIDDVIVTGVLVSGVEETLFNTWFNLYPNPSVNGMVSINAKESLVAVRIYNINGELVKNILNPSGSIDLTGFAAGTYLAQPAFDNGRYMPPVRLVVQ